MLGLGLGQGLGQGMELKQVWELERVPGLEPGSMLEKWAWVSWKVLGQGRGQGRALAQMLGWELVQVPGQGRPLVGWAGLDQEEGGQEGQLEAVAEVV